MISKKIKLSEDVIASIKTSGIIGQKFVDISPGGSDIMLEPGEEIYNTEASLDIESLVKKLCFRKINGQTRFKSCGFFFQANSFFYNRHKTG